MSAQQMTVLAVAIVCGLSWAALLLTDRGWAVLAGWHMTLGANAAHQGHRRRRRRRAGFRAAALHPVTALVAVTLLAALIVGYQGGSDLALHLAGCS